MGRNLLGYDPWNDYVVRGTGVASIDNAEFAQAVTTMNARTKGSIIIDRKVRLNGFHNLLQPIGLRGRDSGAELELSGSSAWVAWGAFTYPWSSGLGVSFTAATAGASTIVSPNLALDQDDYVAIWGENVLTDVTAHNPDTSYLPMEIVRVSQAVTGSASTWRFADMIDDPMNLNQKIVKLSMIKGVRVSDLKVTHEFGTGFSGQALRFGYCADLKVENLTFGWPNGGQLGINMCHGTQISGVRILDAENYNDGGLGTGGVPVIYGIVVGPAYDTQIEHCAIQNVRHPVTTGGINWYRPWTAGETVVAGDLRWKTTVPQRGYVCTVGGTCTSQEPNHTDGSARSTTPNAGNASYGVTWRDANTNAVYRIGSIKNFTFRNNICKNNAFQPSGGTAYSGMTCVDTHTEGRHIVIEGNKIVVSGEAQNVGISVRSRDTIIRNNTIECGTQALGINVVAANCIIEGNTIDGGFMNVVAAPDYTNPSNVNNAIWTRNTFRNMFGPGIRINSGNGHKIIGNTFENVAYSHASNSPVKACVWVQSLVDSNATVDIIDNSMPKRSNDIPIGWNTSLGANQVRAWGNRCDGYEPGLISPMWRASETIATNLQPRRNADREYRWTGGAGVNAGGTAPTHTSGTTNNWLWMRDCDGAKLAEWEVRNGNANRDFQLSVINKTAHGITTASRYFPISSTMTLYDDTSGAATDGRVIFDIISENHLLCAEPGATVQLPTNMISGSYSITSDGYNLYWDLSASGYKPLNLGHGNNPVMLKVTSYTANYLQALLPVASQSAGVGTTPYDLLVSVGDETSNLSAGTNKITFRAPRAFTLSSVRANVTEAPTGSTLICDINVNGTSILSTKLSIDATEKTSTTAASQAVLTTSTISDDVEFTIDIDQVGSALPGKGLKVLLRGSA